MHTGKHCRAAITRQKSIWCWYLTASDSSAMPSWVEEEMPYSVFEETQPSDFKIHGWPSRKWSWQHISVYCSPSSVQNHMSLNHFNADELPYSYMKWKTQRWSWKKQTHSQSNIEERKHQINSNNNDNNTLLNIHIEKSVKTQQHISSHINNRWAKHSYSRICG